jgi:hypothetical protein
MPGSVISKYLMALFKRGGFESPPIRNVAILPAVDVSPVSKANPVLHSARVRSAPGASCW